MEKKSVKGSVARGLEGVDQIIITEAKGVEGDEGVHPLVGVNRGDGSSLLEVGLFFWKLEPTYRVYEVTEIDKNTQLPKGKFFKTLNKQEFERFCAKKTALISPGDGLGPIEPAKWGYLGK